MRLDELVNGLNLLLHGNAEIVIGLRENLFRKDPKLGMKLGDCFGVSMGR